MIWKNAMVLLLFVFQANAQITTRIIGGMPTTINQYPVMAQLLLDPWEVQQFTQYCAGIILTVRNVITTAHCFHFSVAPGKDYRHPKFWKIRVGSSNRNKGGMVTTVNKIVFHPSFEKIYYNNDVAVVTSSDAFKLSGSVKQATIPKQGSDLQSNVLCEIVGWGAKEVGGQQPDNIHYTKVKPIDGGICNARYQQIGAKITDAMLCAGWLDQNGIDGCYGDSGGPLICNGLIFGLVSFGYACGHTYYPGVYTKVSHFTDWIVQTVMNNN